MEKLRSPNSKDVMRWDIYGRHASFGSQYVLRN